jgi:phage baseplate assembly protein V
VNVAQMMARLRILIDRAVLTRVRYVGKSRVLQITPREDSPFDDIEHCEPFGFTSHPPAGAEAIPVSFGGNRGRTVVIMLSDRRHRIVIAEGESAIYNMHGDKVHIKNDGTIGMVASTKVEIISPLTVLSGDLDVGGNIVCDGSIDSAGDQIAGAGNVSQIGHKHKYHPGGGGLTDSEVPT